MIAQFFHHEQIQWLWILFVVLEDQDHVSTIACPSVDALRAGQHPEVAAKAAQRQRELSHSSGLDRLGYRYGQPKLDLKHRQDPKEVARAKRQKACALKKRKPAPVVVLSRMSMKPSSI